MIAWIKFGNGETPESSNLKGDHLIENIMSLSIESTVINLKLIS